MTKPVRDDRIREQAWRFFDIVLSTLTNPIANWYERLDGGAKAAFDAALKYLSITEYQRWTPNEFKWLSGGIGEVRYDHRRVEYRPLVCSGAMAKQLILLVGCTKKQRIYKPPDAMNTAKKRLKEYRRNGQAIERILE